MVKRIAVALVVRGAISALGRKAVGETLIRPRAARSNCSTRPVPRSLALAMILPCVMFLLFCCSLAAAQSRPLDQQPREPNPPNARETSLPAGTVSGRDVDQTGNGVARADLKLMRDQESVIQEVQSDADGEFSFAHVLPGPLQLTVVADGFATQVVSTTMRFGENCVLAPITLSLATQITEIHVSPAREEISQDQFKALESNAFWFAPNFYVSYVGDAAAPLTAKQKSQLAWKATMDPVTIAAVNIIAGVDQATNRFSGYGQGAQGYGKRYGAAYANFASRLVIGGAILPSLLKQDPRYFYKGTGTKRSRFLYAISRTVVTKGHNQRWQPNYSSVLGDLAAGGISNLYIPERDRHGAALTFENAAIGLGTTAAINIRQEFVLRKVTSNAKGSADF